VDLETHGRGFAISTSASLPRAQHCLTHLANAGIHLHVEVDGLIGDDREPAGNGANMLALTVLYIEHVGAWRQCYAIVPLGIRRKSRDLLFSLLAENDHRVISKSFRSNCGQLPISRLNRVQRNYAEMSLEKTRRRRFVRRHASRGKQEEASENQILLQQFQSFEESGRDSYSLSRPSQGKNLR